MAVSCFGAVDGFSKILVDSQSFGQIMLAHYAPALVTLLTVSGPGSWRAMYSTRRPGLQVIRGLSHFCTPCGLVADEGENGKNDDHEGGQKVVRSSAVITAWPSNAKIPAPTIEPTPMAATLKNPIYPLEEGPAIWFCLSKPVS